MRKITVDEVEYQFQVGKKFTKIVGPNKFNCLAKNADIATDVDLRCECCGEPMRELYPHDGNWHTTKIVTKRGVRQAILNKLNP